MKNWNQQRRARIADEQLARQLAIADAASDLVGTVDADGFLLSLNAAGYQLLGINPAHKITKLRLLSFYDSASRKRFVEHDIPKAIKFNSCQSEITLVDGDLTEIPCSQVLVAHGDSNGSIEFFSLIIRDIRAIKAAEKERLHLQLQLHQAQKMEIVGQLAGGIAHDFNNFITVIMGHAELGLIGEGSSPELQKDLEIILDSAQKAARLTAQLLDYSRKKIVEPQILDLNAVIRDSMQLLHTLMGDNILIKTDLDVNAWPVPFDRSQLEQVIFNLAVNARDAMAGTGKFVITTQNSAADRDDEGPANNNPSQDFVTLLFTDTGCGMEAAVMEHIFEPLFTTKGKGKGTGMGLAAVYGAIKQQAGDIRVASKPGEGTTFTIRLPALRNHKLADPPVPFQKRSTLSTDQETILLVEDNSEVRSLMRKQLARLDYKVLTAKDGFEGKAMFEAHSGEIALLVTDVVMPGLTGIQLAEQLTDQDQKLKVLLVSGHHEEIVSFDNCANPNIRMLNKPFAMDRFAREVGQLLGN
jgi:signal transduction histidine kinase/CheY-like chemotaxis protein